MKRLFVLVLFAAVAAVWCGRPCCGQQETRPADAAGAGGNNYTSAEKELIVESLTHSARNMAFSPDAPHRAKRMVALVRFAKRIDGSREKVNRLLAFVYRSQGRIEQELQAVEKIRRASPNDYETATRWLGLHLDLLDRNTEQRVSFLKEQINRSELPGALRAEAMGQLAAIYHGQGNLDQARDMLEKALSLDEHNPTAIKGLLELAENMEVASRIGYMLDLVQGRRNPEATASTMDIALALGDHGLYTRAVEFFDALAGTPSMETDQPDFAVAYLSALLDAGQYQRALEIFQPEMDKLKRDTDFLSLMVEAYRAAGRSEEASKVVESMQEHYQTEKSAAEMKPAVSREMAWFYLHTLDRPATALIYARQASKAIGHEPVLKRILGAAELKSGRAELIDSGLGRLEKLLDSDVYAAVYLAQYHFANGDDEEARKAIMAGAELTRSGPAYRRLRRIADQHDVKIPPAENAEAIAEVVDKFDRRYLRMVHKPDEFISVRISPAEKIVPVGGGVRLSVTLTNTSEIAVPLGQWGLIRPTVGFSVELTSKQRNEAAKTFANLPISNLPAPAYLAPGKSISREIRIDVGELEEYLLHRPLVTFTLSIDGVVDPVQRGRNIVSAAPKISGGDVKVTRASLLRWHRLKGNLKDFKPDIDRTWPAAYRRLLGLIVRDLTKGDTAVRMRAARQIASLLAMSRLIEQVKMAAPDQLTGVVKKPVLLTMTRETLRDDSPAVRAESLTYTQYVALDERIISLLSPLVNDKDAATIVKFRLVELLGAGGGEEQKSIIDYYAQDDDEMVRLMAEAFGESVDGK